MMRFITIVAFLSAYFIFLYKMEVRNKKIEQDEQDMELIRSYSRFSKSKKIQDAYNRQYPIDEDTLEIENI